LAVVCTLALPALAFGQAWPEERPPGPLEARPVDFPPYAIRTLANGLQVVVVPQHEQPAVSYRLIVKAGAMQDPDNRPGVSALVAALLNQGTTTRSAGEIATAVDSAGGFLGVGSGNELTYISGAVIKDRTDAALDLVSEIVQHPAFSPQELDRQRRQILSSLQVSYDDPDYLATLVFDRVVYGDHPYGRPMTAESVSRITREDLVAFHQAWFAPNNALLAIVGDLPEDEAFGVAERAFGSWAPQDVPSVTPPAPPAPARRLVIIDRPGSAQTEMRVGHLGISRTDPSYLPFDLAIRILGGEGANRLFGVLRSDRGLTYGASASLNTYRNTGMVVAETDTRTAATAEALRLMVDEFWRLQREPVGRGELSGVRQFVGGNYPLTIESPAAIAEQVLAHLFYGLDPSEIETYRDRVDRVTPGDIQRAARNLLHPDALSIVLVGDASAFADDLRALGFTEFDRIPLSQLDLNTPGLRRAPSAAVRPAAN